MNLEVMPISLPVALPTEVLDRLMPMHLLLDEQGRITHAGPTISKVLDISSGDTPCIFGVFDVSQSMPVVDWASLMALAGTRLSLVPRTVPHLSWRGVVVPVSDGAGAILDISFGLSFAQSVQEFSLTMLDFSPCDQTVEILYLHEANACTAELSRRLSERLQSAHAAAQHQARTDVLTSLGNRRAMDDELARLLSSRSNDFTLLHLDLDHFKRVNDTYGHAAGDAVLIHIGRILDQELRRNDFPARVGGDEFLIILRPALDAELSARIARRLINRIEEPILFKQALCNISASIGIASTKQYGTRPTVERLMADVDSALYQAKNAGRGRYVIYTGEVG